MFKRYDHTVISRKTRVRNDACAARADVLHMRTESGGVENRCGDCVKVWLVTWEKVVWNEWRRRWVPVKPKRRRLAARKGKC